MKPDPESRQAKAIPHGIRMLAACLSVVVVVLAYAAFAVLQFHLTALVLLLMARPSVTVPTVVFLMRVVVRLIARHTPVDRS